MRSRCKGGPVGGSVGGCTRQLLASVSGISIPLDTKGSGGGWGREDVAPMNSSRFSLRRVVLVVNSVCVMLGVFGK